MVRLGGGDNERIKARAACRFIYDSVKVAFNLPRPPPPSMPESLKKKLEAAAGR